MSKFKVLLIDDEATFHKHIINSPLSEAFHLEHSFGIIDVINKINEKMDYDAVLLDLNLDKGEEGLSILPLIKQQDIPVVITTNDRSSLIAIEIMRQGADEFLQKQYYDPEIWIDKISSTIKNHKKKNLVKPLAVIDSILPSDNDSLQKDTKFYELEKFGNKQFPIVIKHIDINELNIFEEISWYPTNHINIILGENGKGKTELLRYLLVMLRNDEQKVAPFYRNRSTKKVNDETINKIELVRYEKNNEKVIRNIEYGFKGVAPVPVLGIVDNRSINKSIHRIKDYTDELTIVDTGADNFIRRQPMEKVILKFIRKLIKYKNKDGNFDRSIFQLISNGYKRLTDRPLQFTKPKAEDLESDTDEKRDSDNNLFVRSHLNPREAIEIQRESQGTLSILAIIGLIYYFLEEKNRQTNEAGQYAISPEKENGIVFIDEIDAHLHPKWQQKIVPLLREIFPNVQFFMASHSPLVVAGCNSNEVCVVEKGKGGKTTLRQFSEHFIGSIASSHLYRKVFDLEEKDESYIELETAFYNMTKDNIKKLKEALEETYLKIDDENLSEEGQKELEEEARKINKELKDYFLYKAIRRRRETYIP